MMEELKTFLEWLPYPFAWWVSVLIVIGFFYSIVGAVLFFLEYGAMILMFHIWLLIVLPYQLWNHKKDLNTGFWKSLVPFDHAENDPASIPGPMGQLRLVLKRLKGWHKSNES